MGHSLSIVFTAYLLDLIFGDPQWRWHPVRIIGRLIEKIERELNLETVNKKFSGVMIVILVVGVTIFCVWLILKSARLIHSIFYYIVSILLIYFALSIRALGQHVDRVYRALRDKDINEARKNLSTLVARDTDKLDEPQIIRATVETVAESIMDGIIAPMFYVFLGGPILVWLYKAINTLDSMVGYRSERFREFGRPAAKIDGLLNFIPAKMTCLLIFISAWCLRKYGINSGKWLKRYLLKGQEYNSEATEAVMAASLGVQLGGLNFYNSLPIQKNLIGDELCPLNIKHIKESIKIAYISSILFMIGMSLIIWLTGRR